MGYAMNTFFKNWMVTIQSAIATTGLGRVSPRPAARRRRSYIVPIVAEVVESRLQLSAVTGLLAAEPASTIHNAAKVTTTGSISTNTGSHLTSEQVFGNFASAATSTINPTHLLHTPTENDPRDLAEDFASSHAHSSKGGTSTHLLSGTPNTVFKSSANTLAFASLSSNSQSLPVLMQPDRKSLIVSANSSASAEKTTQDQSQLDGLIDISNKQSSKLAKQPVTDISTESTSETNDTTLIAARVAMPRWRTQTQPVESPRTVPLLFTKNDDGGFIELTNNTSRQIPEKRGAALRQIRNLTRYDQVDAEVGRFVAFGQAELFDRKPAITLPKKVAAAATNGEATSDPIRSTQQLSWGLALTAGLAAVFSQPRLHRRVTRLLENRWRQARSVLDRRVAGAKDDLVDVIQTADKYR